MTSSGDLSSVGRLSLVAGVAALLCLAAPEVDSAVAEDREQATVNSPAGVIGLPRGSGRVRVRISATAQPLLRAATASPVRRLLRPAAASPRVQSGIVPIGASERRGARRNEAAYEAGDLGARGRGSQPATASGPDRRCGSPPGWSGPRGRAGTGRGRGEPEPKPGAIDGAAPVRPGRGRRTATTSLSGIGTSAIGAPSWWAAGLTGGTGSADTVPADAAIHSEAADPTHPAFAGPTSTTTRRSR